MTGVVAVTGASGVVGRHLCDHLRRAGWDVRAMLRDPSSYPFREKGISLFRLNLPDSLDPAAFRGADVVIHAAYATRGGPQADARGVNEAGTERVLAQARSAGAGRFVFVSSLSARPDAVSYYGQSKLAMEFRLDPGRDLVVRPGLVLASDGGLALRMWRSLVRARVAPVFDGGGQVVQTVHVADLCTAFEHALTRNVTGTVSVAEVEGLTMRQLLKAMARAAGVRVALLPLPAGPALAALEQAERFGVPMPVTAENLLGLVTMRRVDTAADIQRLGVAVRAAPESLAALAPLVWPSA